ncbi:hypothetical protein [Pedobacter sp. SYSU D00535]|uniref:hypothetical protein n=1 Tax=Pedobacter sp. SYSU D00535 TaxID=2810308 RepID=UPI001A95F25C|nr:hypothetical protein [Pedobacter sp. SYSU D00535]
MSFVTILFALVFVIPLLVFIFSIIWKDKDKRKIGALVIAVLVVFAIIVASIVNRGK